MTMSSILNKKVGAICDKLGQSVKWTNAAGTTLNIKGIFSKDNTVAFAGSVAMQKTTPIVKVSTKQVSGIARDNIIIIDSITYGVLRFESDPFTGETKIYLKVT